MVYWKVFVSVARVSHQESCSKNSSFDIVFFIQLLRKIPTIKMITRKQLKLGCSQRCPICWSYIRLHPIGWKYQLRTIVLKTLSARFFEKMNEHPILSDRWRYRTFARKSEIRVDKNVFQSRSNWWPRRCSRRENSFHLDYSSGQGFTDRSDVRKFGTKWTAC